MSDRKKNDDISVAKKGVNNDINPNNELNSLAVHGPEIDQPGPSIATPAFPQEMPAREL